MSANNEVIIIENKRNEFEVHINNCVDEDFTSSKETLLKTYQSLKSACKFTNKYCNEEMIEYGVRLMLR